MKLVCLLVLCACFQIANAQFINKLEFEKSVDYLNCKTVEFTLKDQSLAKFKERCDCNAQITFEQLSSFLNEEKIGLTLDLSAEIETLKSQFRDHMTIGHVVNYLTSDVFSERTRYAKLYSFENKNGRKDSPEYRMFKADLRERIFSNLASSSQEKFEVSKLEDKVIGLERELMILQERIGEPEERAFGLAYEFDVISLITSAILFATLFWLLKRKESNHSTPDKDWVKGKIEEVRQSSKDDNRSLRREIGELQEEISELKSSMVQFQPSVDNEKVSTVAAEPLEHYQPLGNSASTILYFSTPDTDGSFTESAAHNSYKEGATIYKFRKLTSTQAEFVIDEREPSIRLALQYPDRNIDPVCEAINAFNPRAKAITTLDGGQGLVELMGGKWKVFKKALIRYDN